jgi:hypothetical protein
MTEDDRNYLEDSLRLKHIKSHCLEVGSAVDWSSCRPFLDQNEVKTTGIDINEGKYVDTIIDLEQDLNNITDSLGKSEGYSTIICFNVLEHVYNPIKVLENLTGLLQINGHLLISTPISWPIHAYPDDFWRPLPNFYKTFARKNGLNIIEDRFQYLGFGPVSKYLGEDGCTGYPPPIKSKFHFLWGRLIHKVFSTFGKEYLFPNHLAQAATFIKKG